MFCWYRILSTSNNIEYEIFFLLPKSAKNKEKKWKKNCAEKVKKTGIEWRRRCKDPLRVRANNEYKSNNAKSTHPLKVWCVSVCAVLLHLEWFIEDMHAQFFFYSFLHFGTTYKRAENLFQIILSILFHNIEFFFIGKQKRKKISLRSTFERWKFKKIYTYKYAIIKKKRNV